ncbi:MAG: YggS family pyridoxal phosphate-dependent enzyme [Clostridia bacterium]|nr:YggS family pyridoxal phosphate-dependent enzyme [Clostridia bacterium]
MTELERTEIKENLDRIFNAVKDKNVTVVAATKTVDVERINYAIECGLRDIGENRVGELLEKYEHYDKRARVHFIGQLQRNKVKYIIDKVCLIHSVDSIPLADEIEKQARKHGIVMDVLVEVNIGREASKGGVMPEDLDEILDHIRSLEHVKVRGLMTIGPKIENVENKSHFFSKMSEIFIDISTKNVDNSNMDILSMGMSADYLEAVECGATMIRPGTALFGKRNYDIK